MSEKKQYVLKDYRSQFGELKEGTCEMCFHTSRFVDQTYVFQEQDNTDSYYNDNELYSIDFRVDDVRDDLLIDNIINFAVWLKDKKFSPIPKYEFEKVEWLTDVVQQYNSRLDDYDDYY